MGTNLDEIVSNKSYLVQEMTKKNGIIYSFTHTTFTLGMDVDLGKEPLSEGDFQHNSISYINAISYGRVALLIIESDYHIDKIRQIVCKTLRKDLGGLTPKELITA